MEKITKADTARVIGVIIAAYPSIDGKYSSDVIEAMTNTWALMFEEDDPKLVTAAVLKHIAVSKWVPTIAEIRSIMVDITRPEIIAPDVAWSIVSDYLYVEKISFMHSHEKVELPPMVKRAVEIIGFNALKEMSRGSYANYREGAARQAFMDVYRPMYEREREDALLPRKTAGDLAERTLACGKDCDVYIKRAISAREAVEKQNRRFLRRYRRDED